MSPTGGQPWGILVATVGAEQNRPRRVSDIPSLTIDREHGIAKSALSISHIARPASSATRRSRYGITLAGMAMPFSL